MEKWHVLDRDLERVLGRRLYPDRYDICRELDGVITQIESAATRLEASEVDDEAMTDLQFAAQVLADLHTSLGFDR
jgi:hypothetical protein